MARLFCTNCRGYHELCLACANDVEIPGENTRVGDQIDDDLLELSRIDHDAAQTAGRRAGIG